MKILGHILVLLMLCCNASWARVAAITDFFSMCATPSNSGGRSLTVDPLNHGKDTYPNLSAALQAARPGDTIALMTSDYGDLNLNGINQNGFITIAAAPGQSPKFTSIKIGGYKPASHWRLIGLTVSAFSHPVNNKLTHNTLVLIANSDNLIFERNNINSSAGTIDWRPEVTEPGPPNTPSNGISARQSFCVSIVENHLSNIFTGIDFGGDQKGNNGKYFLVAGNTIDNFAGDGIDHYGSHVRILGNRITNGHDVCNNQCVHNDGIQGWNYNSIPVVNSDVVIDGNTIIAQITPDLVLPIDTLQGITIFDGGWNNVRISNNLIVTNAWHGISMYGVEDAVIVNNTVAPTNPARATWIMIHAAKGAPPGTSYTALVRNNVFPGTPRKEPSGPGITSDHNLALGGADDYADAFVKFDPEHFAYDLHPSRKSPVIGEGSAQGAPATDIDGHPRKGAIDIGAYSSGG